MMRVVPWEEPRSWPGSNRSMPTTLQPRRARLASAALPMAPSPITTASQVGISRVLRADPPPFMRRAPGVSKGRSGPERLEITAIFAEGGVVKLGLAILAIGVVWGNCVAAQVPAPPWPPIAPSGPYDAPAAPVDKPETAPSACQLRLTPDRAVFRSMGDLRGPHGCGGADVVSLERVIGKNHQAIEISPPAVLRCETAEEIVNWVRDDLTARATVLGSNLAVIENFDSYECRGRNRIPGAQISEHGHANALDIRSFK